MKQLSGSVSNAIKEIRGTVLHEIAFIESALDDPEHISLDGYPEQLQGIVEEVSGKIEKLLSTSDNGHYLTRYLVRSGQLLQILPEQQGMCWKSRSI